MQAGFFIEFLLGEAVRLVGAVGLEFVAGVAEGIGGGFFDEGAIGIGSDAGGAEVVAVVVAEAEGGRWKIEREIAACGGGKVEGGIGRGGDGGRVGKESGGDVSGWAHVPAGDGGIPAPDFGAGGECAGEGDGFPIQHGQELRLGGDAEGRGVGRATEAEDGGCGGVNPGDDGIRRRGGIGEFSPSAGGGIPVGDGGEAGIAEKLAAGSGVGGEGDEIPTGAETKPLALLHAGGEGSGGAGEAGIALPDVFHGGVVIADLEVAVDVGGGS